MKQFLKVGCITVIGGVGMIIFFFFVGVPSILNLYNEQAKDYSDFLASLPVIEGKLSVGEQAMSPLSGESAAWIIWVWDQKRRMNKTTYTIILDPNSRRQVHFPGKDLRLEVEGKSYPIATKRGYFSISKPQKRIDDYFSSSDREISKVLGYDTELTAVVEALLGLEPSNPNYLYNPASFKLIEYYFNDQQEITLYGEIVDDTVRLAPWNP